MQITKDKLNTSAANPVADIAFASQPEASSSTIGNDESENFEKHKSEIDAASFNNENSNDNNSQLVDALIHDIHNPDNMPIEELITSNPVENKASSDKQIKGSMAKTWKKLIYHLDKFANWSAIAANVGGAFLQLTSLPDQYKDQLSKIVDTVTNLSFTPYSLDGLRIAATEKKNLFSAIGYAFEGINVWLSNLKTKYLIRGLGTGLDQIWVATDKRLAQKTNGRIKDGRFSSYSEGIVMTLKECGTMLKEIVQDPFNTILKLKSDGYHALVSTLGDIVATVGFALTGQEKLFGTVRDVAAAFFDMEMVLSEDPTQKLSGAMFISESILDFVARFMPAENLKLFVNQLSHASGRLAIHLYKQSDPNNKVD